MSFRIIIEKILLSIREEIKKEENIDVIAKDIIKPIVERILDNIYPYFIGSCIIIVLILLVIFSILILNLKIYYK
jgi:hypothetical protein